MHQRMHRHGLAGQGRLVIRHFGANDFSFPPRLGGRAIFGWTLQQLASTVVTLLLRLHGQLGMDTSPHPWGPLCLDCYI